MTALDTLRDRLTSKPREARGRRRRASARPRLEGLEDRIVLDATPSSTTLAITPTGSQSYGTTLTLTADVNQMIVLRGKSEASPVTGGTVTFEDGSQVLGTAPVSGGVATLATATLPFGDNTIVASFGGYWVEEKWTGYDIFGDYGTWWTLVEVNSPSTSTTVTETIVAAPAVPSATTVTPSVAAPAYGQPETFTATVAASSGTASPQGTIQFLVDGVASGPVVGLSASDTATFDGSALPAGTHTIEADFSEGVGVASLGTSSVTVAPASTTTVVVPSVAAPVYGQPETFTATVADASSAVVPTGSVQFQVDGADSGGPVKLSGGTATFSDPTLAPGPHTITALDVLDPDFSGAASSVGVIVSQATATTTVSTSASTVDYGQAATLTAAVAVASPSAASPTGSVQFAVDGAAYGSPVALANGVATLGAVVLGSGAHVITATPVLDQAAGIIAAAGSAPLAVRPGLVSIARSDPAGPEGAGPAMTYAVTFSEPVTGVTPADFRVVTTGTVAASPSVAVSGSGASYLVTISGIAGAGTLDLALASVGGIVDSAGLSLPPAALFAPEATYAAGATACCVAVADFNGDGIPDLAVANAGDSTVSLLIGRGDGSFAPQATYAVGSSPWSVSAGDLTGDGKIDLVTANYGAGTVSVLMGNGDGTFAPAVSYNVGANPESVKLGDLTGDGRLDIVTANWTDGTISVLLNDGDGTFAPQVTYHVGSGPDQLAIGDLNGDGLPDIAVTNKNSNTVSVLLNQGEGTFAPEVTYAVGSQPNGMAIGGVTGDGKADIVVANQGDDTVGVLLGNGDGTFAPQATYAVGSQPTSVSLADLEGDGRLDVVATDYAGAAVSILSNEGGGAFAPQVSYPVASQPNMAVVADLEGDGVPDIVTSANVDNVAGVLMGQVTAGPAYDLGTSSRLALAASETSTVYGQPVTLTATVAPVAGGSGTPTGTVTFYDGSIELGSSTLSGGVASLTSATLPSGSDTIAAVYAGDLNFFGSDSSTILQVAAAASSIVVDSSIGSAVFGQAVNLTATVSAASGAGMPTGTVMFYDGSMPLGSATLSGGSAVLGVASLPVGSAAITAVYGGDGNFNGGTSTPTTIQVDKDATIVSMIAALDSPDYGQPEALMVQVFVAAPGSGTPTGTVIFKDGSTVLGQADLSSFPSPSQATLVLGTPLSAGSHSITATYTGDGNDAPSISPVYTVSVAADATTTGVVASAGSIAFGQAVTFTATVSDAPGDATPSGGVQFFVDGVASGKPVPLDPSGVAAYTPAALPAKPHQVSAAFVPASGDFTASTSPGVSVSVSHTTLRGTVYLDVSGDGSRQAGEPGLAGRTVYLDVKGSGVYDPADPSAVTAADGSFTFTDPPAGSDTLRLVTYGGDVVTGPSGAAYTLVPGQSASGADFGLRLTGTVAPLPVVATPFGPGPNPDAATAIVEGIYNLVLGRPADPQGLANGDAALGKGATAAQLAAFLHATPEYDARVIRSDYETFLGRAADTPGLAGWVKAMQSGWTETQVAEAFLVAGSQGETDAAYVQSLYQDVLGRQAAPAEISAWQATGLSRQAEAVDFVLSSDADSRAIADDYVAILGRQGSAAEVAGWLTLVRGRGWTLDQVAEAFLGSPEFAARAAEAV